VFLNPDIARKAKEQMAEYLVLDAIIGNTDRHHENWGILRKKTASGWMGFLAPTFDHASSLGRELLDTGKGKSRQKILENESIGQYLEKAPGGIYWKSSDSKGISPLELVRRGYGAYPKLFTHAVRLIERLDEKMIEGIIEDIPEDWMRRLERVKPASGFRLDGLMSQEINRITIFLIQRVQKRRKHQQALIVYWTSLICTNPTSHQCCFRFSKIGSFLQSAKTFMNI
jgi:hypothetical protein